ncbi:hypothetical protein SAMN05421676_101330 [Salinibacillus kushneri]|uniref:Uncharacterized protein n=1 Tax=Salinibacillus kushneri TaxID=237682 RepID=A0A1H9YZB6_9BACI|nr:hypothetical protein SAMN05421676_101330 [Salinibacillus kushneri]
MAEAEWDIQEVKRLKKIHLVQYNLVMLLLFIFFAVYAEGSFRPCCFMLRGSLDYYSKYVVYP